jgi:N-methylhydantoinase A
MLMSDLQHDFVRSFVSPLDSIDWRQLGGTVNAMVKEGEGLLAKEKIPAERQRFTLSLDCRYVKQYHEVSFPVPMGAVEGADVRAIASSFHAEHDRMYGYSLEREGTPIELINVRVRAVGITDKPAAVEEAYAGEDPAAALKGERAVVLPESRESRPVAVYDGHRTRFGFRIRGPAIIEQVNTTLFLSSSYDLICDRSGSFAVYLKGREDLVAETLREIHACAK